MKTEQHDFQPDWTSSPGETIADILEERKISPPEFALRLGWTVEETSDLLNGRHALTESLAQKLERELGVPAEFWMNRQAQFRSDLLRVGQRWLRELPLSDMVKFGWISAKQTFDDRLKECLNFFDASCISSWREKYYPITEKAAFRTSPTFESDIGAVTSWLRQAEIEANALSCQAWNAESFQMALPDIRSLTRERDPGVFVPELKRRCAQCGVAMIVLPTPKGCRASGATYFVTADKAILILSFRFLSDDHFWFTFFHEAGHLLLHNKNSVFLEGTASNEGEENEANDFAAHTLVPEEFRAEMFKLPLNGREVMRFARRAGISPGIVVGQLQHHKKFTHRQLNNLKTRFAWVHA